MRSISSTFSYADSVGMRPNDWKTKPTLLRRHLVSLRSLQRPTSSPKMLMAPDVGRSRPPTQFSNVVLPLPERPLSDTYRPAGTVMFTPRRAGMSWPPMR